MINMSTIPEFNIVSEKSIDVSSNNYTDESGFFFHATGAGNIKYCALNDADANAVTKAFAASETFNNPIKARKIFASGTTATGLYVGKAI
jgi:hypothetical protein